MREAPTITYPSQCFDLIANLKLWLLGSPISSLLWGYGQSVAVWRGLFCLALMSQGRRAPGASAESVLAASVDNNHIASAMADSENQRCSKPELRTCLADPGCSLRE